MNNDKKDTDRDFRPGRGQESNENWDDQHSDKPEKTKDSNPSAEIETPGKPGTGSTPQIESDIASAGSGSEIPVANDKGAGTNLTGPGLG